MNVELHFSQPEQTALTHLAQGSTLYDTNTLATGQTRAAVSFAGRVPACALLKALYNSLSGTSTQINHVDVLMSL